MSRGNRQDAIFLDETDCQMFLTTLGEACSRTGWRVHAYVLMGNHYHLLLETPEANLVVGMKWLQGTYTQRFNARHKLWGHLLQGRYKALVVDAQNGEYFLTVANYIHLNPARTRAFDLATDKLTSYRWSSYPLFFRPTRRPEWLVVERVLGAMGWSDDRSGREKYRRLMQRRVQELAAGERKIDRDGVWSKIRRGWCFGDEAFHEEVLARLDRVIGVSGKRDSFDGLSTHEHDERMAAQWIEQGLEVLGLDDEALREMKKSCAEKCGLAWLVRRHTCVPNQWIVDRLHMGRATNFAQLVKRAESGDGELAAIRLKFESVKISD
jgi:REP element-mobilizing transposase RayT